MSRLSTSSAAASSPMLPDPACDAVNVGAITTESASM
eukprot:CAMPEP_0114539934 /NCGR_PEP_ID=MMETSP0114-20121206/501_1 /TAXON_ID=31324 /ORGANISM="Goniomonas sp, Strain m" /LENGTH=36 /DNA_ID= /DNA_START= /DNA_END= /DNA_ORIENTATION=